MASPQHRQITTTWSYDTTAARTLDIASGVIRAATTDNVQVLALEVCRRYGATLGMCPSVIRTVELLAKVKYRSHVIEHLAKAYIGWSGGDCADELASSDWGCRFLALVPPLLTLGGPFKAAQALHGFLRESSPGSQMLPTERQLKDLLSKVEPKLMKSGFTDWKLAGWHIMLTSEDSPFRALFKYQPHSQPSTRTLLPHPTKVDKALVQPVVPEDSVISELVRGLAEIERLGDATTAFLLIRTPARIATWVVAFVDWCLGIPPTIRGLDSGAKPSEELITDESKVLVEIFPSSADVPNTNIVTFRRLKAWNDVLYECQISANPQGPWGGMMKISNYFRMRVHNLGFYFDIFNVEDTLKVLIKDLSHRFRMSALPFPDKLTKPFPESNKLLGLLTRLLRDPGESEARLAIPETHAIQDLWKGRDDDEVLKVADLFQEFLVASLYENLYWDDKNADMYVLQREKGWDKPASPLLRTISDHLRGRLELTSTLLIPMATIGHMMLKLTGVSRGSGKTLIHSYKGQVSYYSFIEDMELSGRCLVQRRVYPGELRFEGQAYDYARTEPFTQLLHTLDTTKVCGPDFAFEPLGAPKDLFEEAGDAWFKSAQEDHMSFYWVPSRAQHLSLDPCLFFQASEGLVFMQGCRLPQCAPKRRLNEVLYCRTVAAALSPEKPQAIRVLSSWGRNSHSLFVKAALAELWMKQDDSTLKRGFPAPNALTIVRGGSCIPCTCAAGLETLKSLSETGRKRMLIVLD